jgi:hypothetical protein
MVVRDKVMAGGNSSSFEKMQLMRELRGAVLEIATDLNGISLKLGQNTALDDIKRDLIQPLDYLKDFYRAAAVCQDKQTGARVLCITPKRVQAHIS